MCTVFTFILDIDVSTEMGLIVVADLDLTQFSIIPELWYDVKIEVLEVLIQFSIIILQCHICCVKVVLESLLQLKVVVHAVEQKSVADLRMGMSP